MVRAYPRQLVQYSLPHSSPVKQDLLLLVLNLSFKIEMPAHPTPHPRFGILRPGLRILSHVLRMVITSFSHLIEHCRSWCAKSWAIEEKDVDPPPQGIYALEAAENHR